MSWLDNITNSMNLSKLQEIVEDRGAWCAVAHGGHKEPDGWGLVTERQQCDILIAFWRKSFWGKIDTHKDNKTKQNNTWGGLL